MGKAESSSREAISDKEKENSNLRQAELDDAPGCLGSRKVEMEEDDEELGRQIDDASLKLVEYEALGARAPDELKQSIVGLLQKAKGKMAMKKGI